MSCKLIGYFQGFYERIISLNQTREKTLLPGRVDVMPCIQLCTMCHSTDIKSCCGGRDKSTLVMSEEMLIYWHKEFFQIKKTEDWYKFFIFHGSSIYFYVNGGKKAILGELSLFWIFNQKAYMSVDYT